jgi:hypothetical protein
MNKGLINNVLLIAIAVLAVFAAGCNSSGNSDARKSLTAESDTGKAIITFSTMEHNFGVVTEGEKVAHLFSFTNTGTSALLLSSAATSCGCTVPEFSRKPVAPGQKGSLEVIFNSAGTDGFQTKTITVQSNASNPVVILAIRAEVKSKTK